MRKHQRNRAPGMGIAALAGVALVALASLGLLPAAPAGAAMTQAEQTALAQKTLFETPYLSELSSPEVLTYRFVRTAAGEPSFEGKVILELTADRPDGRRDVAFEFHTGPDRMPFAPLESVEWNPLVMMFLQRDVILMARRAGGRHGYFRTRILEALRAGPEVEQVTVDFQGKPTEMTRVVIEPYVGDRERARFSAEEHKRYEFLMSSAVPGGIYRIRSLVPGAEDDQVLVEESMTFESRTP